MGESAVTRSLIFQLESVFGKNTIISYDQHFPQNKKTLRTLFESASKRLTGNQGFPDLIVEFKRTKNNYRNLLLVCECKKKIKEHCIPNQPLTMDCPDRYACSGALHYLRCAQKAAKSSNKALIQNMDFIGIAYTKDLNNKGEEKVDIYGVNSRFNETNLQIKHFKDATIKHLPSLIAELYDLKVLYNKVWIKDYNRSRIGILPIYELLKIQFKYEARAKSKDKPHKFQRELAKFKVDGIYDYFYDEASSYNKHRLTNDKSSSISPQGIILLGRYKNNYYILDGQHRLEAYRRLYSKDINNFEVLFQLTDYEILSKMVDSFKAHNSGSGLTDIEYEYTEKLLIVNKNEESGVVINEQIELELDRTEAMIFSVTKVCDFYATKYPNFFSQSPNCYIPHIHYETMKASLQKHLSILDILNDLSETELIETIKKYIDRLNSKFKKEYKNNTKKLAGAYNKCKQKGGLYLGIIRKCKWVDLLL